MIMRKQTLNQILKIISLILSWATLSPLLLILDGRWKLLPKWLHIVLFVLSPMMLVVMAVAAFWGYGYYSEHYIQHHFVRRRVVENITGVRLPRYKVIDQGEEWECFSRSPEHTYDFTLEFKKMPDEDFYEKLAEHFDCLEAGNAVPSSKFLYSYFQKHEKERIDKSIVFRRSRTAGSGLYKGKGREPEEGSCVASR